MTTAVMVTVAVTLWVATGLLIAWLLARRGHQLFGWALTGAFLGPLSGVIAADQLRRSRKEPARQLRAGSRGPGPIDVLVGCDGSRQSEAALGAIHRLFGERLGRLALAAVVTYDVAHGDPTSALGEMEEEDAEVALCRAAEATATHRPDLVMLSGSPADALSGYAREERFHVLAVGSRGRGMAQELLGSVAVGVTAQADVPVVVVGD